MTPSPSAVRELALRLGGRAAHRDDEAWAALAASRFPNLEVPWAPDVVVHAAGTADVIAATQFAIKHGLGLAVRGGGVGWVGAPPGILLVDLRDMHSVGVDAWRRTLMSLDMAFSRSSGLTRIGPHAAEIEIVVVASG